jgi:hypothetical protein
MGNREGRLRRLFNSQRPQAPAGLRHIFKNGPEGWNQTPVGELEGVRYLACKTSADLFELEQEDFLDGVEIMLAEDFMKQAVDSELHMVF